MNLINTVFNSKLLPPVSQNESIMHPIPDRKGFKVLAGGFTGINLSRSTNDAAVGPRKDSGVRHVRGPGAARLSPRRDRSNVSGLLSPRPFTSTGPPSMASSKKSPSDGRKGANCDDAHLGGIPMRAVKGTYCLPEGLPGWR